MTKKRKLLILSLFVCLTVSTVFATESKAEEMSGEQTSSESGMKDENAQRLDDLTTMDETGNVTEEEDAGAKVVESAAAARARSAISAQVVNFRTKGNVVTNYTEDITGASGYTNGAYGADAAYLGSSDGKVRFMMSGVVGWVDASEVQVINLSDAKVVSCYEVSNGRLLHQIATDMTTSGYATSLDNGPAPSYLSGGVSYYSYDGHYFYTDYMTMIADYQNNVRSHSVNAGSPYYNYFQYLPLRSKTGYSDGELNGLINARLFSATSKMYNTGASFVSQQNTYGVNALVMAGIAANESGWGDSSIPQEKNNLFGLDAVDSSPGTSASTYASVEECIRQFANAWMSRGYLNPDDWRYKGGFLGNKASGLNVRYASDPYWGEKAANVMWNLDQSGGTIDYGTYTIGIKDTVSTSHTSVNVRSGDSTATTELYRTGLPSSYAVLILDKQPANSFYRIQSDAVLNPERTAAISSSVGEYNYDSMYAYISSDYTMIVSDGNAATPPAPTPTPKTLDSIYISSPPSKTIYTEGESFDAAGMVVKARWSDASESDVTGSIVYTTEALLKGTAEIQIQYTSEGVTQTAVQGIAVKIAAETGKDPEKPEQTPSTEVKDDAGANVPPAATPPAATPPAATPPAARAPAGTPAVPTIAPAAPATQKADASNTGIDAPKAPKTGDNSPYGLWGILLIASAAGIVGMGRRKYKEYFNLRL